MQLQSAVTVLCLHPVSEELQPMKQFPLSTFILSHIPYAFLITQVIEHSGSWGVFNILVNTYAHQEGLYFNGSWSIFYPSPATPHFLNRRHYEMCAHVVVKTNWEILFSFGSFHNPVWLKNNTY